MKETVSDSWARRVCLEKLGGHGDSIPARETVKMQWCLAPKNRKIKIKASSLKIIHCCF